MKRLLRALSHPLWNPEPDEKRYLFGLPLALGFILFLWSQGIPGTLGSFSIPATFALWSAAYVIKFRRRLKDRGELIRVILAPSVFLAFLLAVYIYARS